MRSGVVGKDQTGDALAASFIVGPFAMFVHGGVVTVPRETLGIAKTAIEFKLPVVASDTAAGVQIEDQRGREE